VTTGAGGSTAACWLHELDTLDAAERVPATQEEIADADEA